MKIFNRSYYYEPIINLIIFVLLSFITRNTCSQSSYCNTIIITTDLADSVFVCDTGSVELDAGNDFVTYHWSNGSTTQSITVNFSGRYFVTVTNDSGCIAIDTSVVSLICTSLTLTDTTVCQGATVSTSGVSASLNANSLVFDGINDYMISTDTMLPNGNLERTFEAWVYNSGQNGNGCIFSYGNWAINQAFAIYIDSLDQLNLMINQTNYSCTDTIQQNTWTHIAVSTDADNKFRFYINGIFINSGPVSGTYSTTLNGSMNIGRSGNASNQGYFYGKIDEVHIWNKALSAPETQMYNYVHLNYSLCIYLLRYWDFNTAVQSTTFDMNGLSGNISGAALSASVPFLNYKYFYTWSSGQNSQSVSLSPVLTTTYYLYSSDGISSCTDSITINVINAPTIPDTLLLCNTPDYTLEPGINYSTFLWNDGSTGSSLTVNVTGTYSVTVTGQGCTFTEDSYLDFISINITEEDTAICYGEAITLHGTSSENIYLWNTGLTLPVATFHPSVTTMYSLFTYNSVNNCNDSIMVHVAYPIDLNLQPSYFTCNTPSLTISVPNPIFAGYQWSTGATTSSVSVANSGIYIVTVTDQAGCTGIDTSVATLLNINIIQGDTIICDGNPVILTVNANASPVIWSNGMTGSTITVDPLVTTTYTATISNGTNTCSDNVILTVGSPLYLVLQDSIFSCLSPDVELNVSSLNSIYHWNNGATTPSITVENTGLYSVTVTNTSGCTASAQSFVSLIYADITPSANNVCPDSLIILNTNSLGFSYQWSTGETDPVIFVTPGQSTIYFVTVTDGYGTCIYSEPIVVIPVNTGPIYGPVVVYADTTVTYYVTPHAGSNYQWFVSGGIYTPTNTDSITINWGFGETGYVSVVETNSYGCIGQPSELYVDIIFHISVGDISVNKDFLIAPNPVVDESLIHLPDNDNEGIIEFYDITGKLFCKIKPDNRHATIIPAKKFNKGVYFVKYISYMTRVIKVVVY